VSLREGVAGGLRCPDCKTPIRWWFRAIGVVVAMCRNPWHQLSPNPEGEQWRDDLDVGPRPSPLECYCAARAGEGHKLGDHTPTREKG
jgi:hypothetical protein